LDIKNCAVEQATVPGQPAPTAIVNEDEPTLIEVPKGYTPVTMQ
jgi:hypothetical protein